MKHYLLSYSRKRQYFLFAGDLIVLAIAVLVSYGLRIFINTHTFSFGQLVAKLSPWLILVIMPHLLSIYLLDLYNLNRLIYRFRSSVMIVVSVLLAGLAIGSIFFFLPKYVFGRQVLVIHLFISGFCLICWRFVFNELLAKTEKVRRIAFVGSITVFNDFFAKLSKIQGSGLRIACADLLSPDSHTEYWPHNVKRYDNLDQMLADGAFDILVFDVLGNRFDDDDTRKIMQVKYNGKAVFDLPSFFKNLTGKISLSYIDGSWILNQQSMQGQIGGMYVHGKRLIDIIGSSLLIVMLAPLYLIVALLIKNDSKGPVLFRQERLGLHRRPFSCLKFRSMVESAEQLSGPTWATDEDPRITKIGRILRKTRLDELPQLWNVLRGDISFVGPRPIREHFANLLAEQIPYYGLRFSVQPGLSGWAQINYDYAGSEEGQREKFEYELFYIQNLSLFIDVLVIFKTFRTVVRGLGK